MTAFFSEALGKHDRSAAAFYREHQFQPFVSRPGALYLPMKTALALVAQGTGRAKS